MNDEDFVLGYATGYNDGKASGGGSGGSTVDVPILHNYSFTGTDFGIAVIDVNQCTFLNAIPSGNKSMDHNTNPITGLEEVYIYPKHQGYGRYIAFALTKGGKAIGVYRAPSASYTPFSFGMDTVRIEDGTVYFRKNQDITETVENLKISCQEVPNAYDDSYVTLKVYLTYDVERRTIKYSSVKSNYNSEYLFTYYNKSDLDAQTVESDITTTSSRSVNIFNLSKKIKIADGDNYPTEWINKYPLNNGIFNIGNCIAHMGMSADDEYELTMSLCDGIA